MIDPGVQVRTSAIEHPLWEREVAAVLLDIARRPGRDPSSTPEIHDALTEDAERLPSVLERFIAGEDVRTTPAAPPRAE